MTDRFYALTVVLEKDIREDDAEHIINAIRMIKGVIDVEGNITTPETWMAEERARRELRQKLIEIIYPHLKEKNES